MVIFKPQTASTLRRWGLTSLLGACTLVYIAPSASQSQRMLGAGYVGAIILDLQKLPVRLAPTMAQKAVYTPIIMQSAEDNACPNIPIGLHQEGDKHNRISAGITNALFRKILYWDETLPKRSEKDYNAFTKQLFSFEKGTASNDDAPDTLERAITLA